MFCLIVSAADTPPCASQLSNSGLAITSIGCLIGLYKSGSTKDVVGDVPVWLWRSFIGLSLLMLVIAFAIYARHQSIAELTSAMAGMFAASAVGGAFGFLFGIPRALQSTAATAPLTGGFTGYASNTNLERVSDWLTTIIIGLSLAEFQTILEYFNNAARTFATDLCVKGIFMPGAILAASAISGFLGTYLWTRIRLMRDFSDADSATRQGPEYFEGLMYAYLFNDPPRGYERAIELGEQYLDRFQQVSPRVWLYFTCAYGQKHAYLMDQGTRGKDVKREDIEAAGNAALIFCERTLSADPSSIDLLESLRKGGAPGRYVDDDLASLKDDKRFDNLFAKFRPNATPTSMKDATPKPDSTI